jgi:hypothetical protein
MFQVRKVRHEPIHGGRAENEGLRPSQDLFDTGTVPSILPVQSILVALDQFKGPGQDLARYPVRAAVLADCVSI